jgi:hypothetical protein
LHEVLMIFIEKSSFRIRKWTWPFMKRFISNLFAWSSDDIYWMGVFHDKRTNFIVYKKQTFTWICIEFWWHLLNGSSSTIREGTWPFTSCFPLIWFARIVMGFIEWELFHDKRRNLTFYEMLSVVFICTESWWHLLNGNSSAIREGTWGFTKGPHWILFARIPAMIDWMGALPRWEKELDILWNAPSQFYL